MKTFLPLLLLVSSNFYLALSNQNLCDDAKKAGFIFANDPSECSRYLFCERDASDAITVVHQMICDDPDYPNFLNDGCFSNDLAKGGVQCVEGIGNDLDELTPNPDYLLSLCPGANTFFETSTDNYADPADDTCQKYTLCRGDRTVETTPEDSTATPTFPFTSCSGTLLFDRNFGRCTLPENAPCGPANAPLKPNCLCDGSNSIIGTDCSNPINIPFPNNCYKYATCLGGELIAENECAGGLQFNPKTGQCDRTTNIAPPCAYARFSEARLASLPRAQPKSRKINPLIPQLRNILMAKRYQ